MQRKNFIKKLYHISNKDNDQDCFHVPLNETLYTNKNHGGYIIKKLIKQSL